MSEYNPFQTQLTFNLTLATSVVLRIMLDAWKTSVDIISMLFAKINTFISINKF